MVVKIVADSSCDINHLDDVNFEVAPLVIYTDERTFIDDASLNIDEMIDYLAAYKKPSYTSCPAIGTWLTCFEGADIIYVVTMTSKLSGTYNAAVLAAQTYLENHPQALIHVFDSLSTGPEMLLIVEKLVQLIKENKSFNDIVNEVSDYQKHTRLFFSLESLRNLALKGRLPLVIANAINTLNIKILATASTDGEIKLVGKCHGNNKTLKTFLDVLDKAGYRGGKVNIGHCKNPTLAYKLQQAILEIYPKALIKVYEHSGLCTYYAETGGVLVGCECDFIYE